MRTSEMKKQGKPGKTDEPDTRKLAAELGRLKKILEDRNAPLSARSEAINRMRKINRETDPARDVIW